MGFPLGGRRGSKVTAIEARWELAESLGPANQSRQAMGQMKVFIAIMTAGKRPSGKYRFDGDLTMLIQ